MVTAIDPCDAGKNWQVTIEMLPDNTLLEIFDFYRLDPVHRSGQSGGRPWKWHRLAHVCRRWRHIIYTSPRRLDLRILCKSGKPIERVLGAWPTLPLVVGFRANSKSKSLPKNVVSALRHTDRVCEINLGVTTPTSQSIANVIQVPFPVLERIRIWSKGAVELLVINEFLGGLAPRLKEIHVGGVGIPFLALRRLLLSTDNLVKLVLDRIPNSCYFSPDDLVTILSSMNYLKELVMRFLPPASRLTTNMDSPPPLERSTRHFLISLDFYGASEYLEAFVARTHMPALTTLTIRFFNQAIFEIPQLYGFISRVEQLESFDEVSIAPTREAVAILFQRKGKHSYEPVRCILSVPCRQLDWQLSFTTQIFNQLSLLLSSAKLLIIDQRHAISTGREDVDSAQWLELFQPLPHLSEVRIYNDELISDVILALAKDTAAGVLPRLGRLRVGGHYKSPSIIDAIRRIMAIRKLPSFSWY